MQQQSREKHNKTRVFNNGCKPCIYTYQENQYFLGHTSDLFDGTWWWWCLHFVFLPATTFCLFNIYLCCKCIYIWIFTLYMYIYFYSLWYVKHIIQGTNKYWDWFENNRYSPRYRDRYLIETKTKYSLRPYFEEMAAIFHWALTIFLAPLTIYFMIISLSPYNMMTSILLLFLLHN